MYRKYDLFSLIKLQAKPDINNLTYLLKIKIFRTLIRTYFQQNNHMLSWMTRCCSSSSSCPFQKALETCTYPDWYAPHQNYFQYLIQCFRGDHKDIIRSQKAFSIFRTKFEKRQGTDNIAFRIKNLLLLDRCTEENCILDLIANYQNNRLFFDIQKSQNSVQNKSFQQFICSYFYLIKKKSDIYQRFPNEFFNKKTRKQYISNSNNLNRIFQFIDNSLQIQKLLNQTTFTLKLVNKSTQLIQTILIFMLKTYLFLYSIVAICLRTLLAKIKLLKFTQLNNLQKLLKYFSREYSNNLLSFIEANKSILAFKNIQYTQIIKIDQNYMLLFDKYYRIKANQISDSPLQKIGSQKSLSGTSTPTTIKSSLCDSQELQDNIQELPNQVYQKLTQQIELSHQPRKIIQQIKSNDAHEYIMAFTEYKNYYSQDFIQDNKQVPKVNEQIDQVGPLMKKKSSRLAKKKSLMQDLINQKSLRKSNLSGNVSKKTNFKESMWITWQNIYSE